MLIQVIIQQKLGSLTNNAYLRAWEWLKPNRWLFSLLKNKCMVFLFWTSFLISLQMHLPIKRLPQSVLKKPMGGALHIRRRRWRFVFGYSKLRNFWIAVRNKGGWLHGVYHILSVVCCEDWVSSTAHFTGVSILQRGCLLWLFTAIGFLRPRISNRQMLSTRAFLYVVSHGF